VKSQVDVDYASRLSWVIQKKIDMFEFRE